MYGSRGGTGGPDPPPPLKNHKNIGFPSNTVPDSLKNRSYQASIQCWGIIGTPVKRHLMAFRWRADDGPLKVVLGSSLPSSTKIKEEKKNVVKDGPPQTNLSGSAHVSKQLRKMLLLLLLLLLLWLLLLFWLSVTSLSTMCPSYHIGLNTIPG